MVGLYDRKTHSGKVLSNSITRGLRYERIRQKSGNFPAKISQVALSRPEVLEIKIAGFSPAARGAKSCINFYVGQKFSHHITSKIYSNSTITSFCHNHTSSNNNHTSFMLTTIQIDYRVLFSWAKDYKLTDMLSVNSRAIA